MFSYFSDSLNYKITLSLQNGLYRIFSLTNHLLSSSYIVRQIYKRKNYLAMRKYISQSREEICFNLKKKLNVASLGRCEKP